MHLDNLFHPEVPDQGIYVCLRSIVVLREEAECWGLWKAEPWMAHPRYLQQRWQGSSADTVVLTKPTCCFCNDKQREQAKKLLVLENADRRATAGTAISRTESQWALALHKEFGVKGPLVFCLKLAWIKWWKCALQGNKPTPLSFFSGGRGRWGTRTFLKSTRYPCHACLVVVHHAHYNEEVPTEIWNKSIFLDLNEQPSLVTVISIQLLSSAWVCFGFCPGWLWQSHVFYQWDKWYMITVHFKSNTRLKNQAWSFSISLLRIWQFLLCKAQMIYAVKFCLSLLITWLLCRKLLDGVFLAVPYLAGTIKSGRAKLRVWDFSTELVWTLWLYSEGWSCYQLL